MNYQDLFHITNKFNIKGDIISVTPYGDGLINSTFLVSTSKKKYILQVINTKLFTDVDGLMNNIALVTDHYHQKNPNQQCLHIISTKSGERYLKENGVCYRIYHFIKNSYSLNTVTNKEEFYLAAKSFGDFMNNFRDFDANQLVEIIPDFHNTKKRYETFLNAVDNDLVHRKSSVLKEIEFVKSRKAYTSKIVNLINSGDIPLRVTHNDTKLNNVLFDKDTNIPLAVIDLDTIMPGTVLYDIGDSIRFGANATIEDDPDLDHVKFKLDYFEAYIKGYLEKYTPTKIEKDNIAFSAILLTYECGMRFLTDYLNGDTYFKCKYPEHNLVRARNQFKLIEEMEKALPQMEEIVRKY